MPEYWCPRMMHYGLIEGKTKAARLFDCACCANSDTVFAGKPCGAPMLQVDEEVELVDAGGVTE